MYVTHKRIKAFGPQVELNPLIRHVASEDGPSAATAMLLMSNLLLLGLISQSSTLLHIFFGAKLSLAALQIRSLYGS